jgi:hypothetical protein
MPDSFFCFNSNTEINGGEDNSRGDININKSSRTLNVHMDLLISIAINNNLIAWIAHMNGV